MANEQQQRDVVPPGPTAQSTQNVMTLAEADARVKTIAHQEFNDRIHQLRTELRKEAQDEVKRDRLVKYGGLAIGGALVGGGITYFAMKRNFNKRNMAQPVATATTTAHR